MMNKDLSRFFFSTAPSEKIPRLLSTCPGGKKFVKTYSGQDSEAICWKSRFETRKRGNKECTMKQLAPFGSVDDY